MTLYRLLVNWNSYRLPTIRREWLVVAIILHPLVILLGLVVARLT